MPQGMPDENTSFSWWAAQWLLGDLVPFLLEYMSKLSDVLWLVKLSPDTYPKNVPQMFNWWQVWGLCWSWESHDSVKLQVILDNTCMMGSVNVVLKDGCIPLLTGSGHRNQLNYIVSVVELRNIPLADVEFCPPSQGDPSPNHDTSTSIAVMCNHGWRLVTLPSSTPNPLPPIMKIENNFGLVWEHSVKTIVQQSTSNGADTIPSLPGDGWRSIAAQCLDDEHAAEQHVDGFLLLGYWPNSCGMEKLLPQFAVVCWVQSLWWAGDLGTG